MSPGNDYLGITSEMINLSGVDVVMGPGHPFYDANGGLKAAPSYKYISQTDWDGLVAGTAGGDANGDASADPWTLVTERAQFQALASGPTPAALALRKPTTSPAGPQRSSDAAPYGVPFVQSVPTSPKCPWAP
jgi:alkaline phosphatase